MKLKATWLLIAFSTFVLGIALVLTWLYLPQSRTLKQEKSGALVKNSNTHDATEPPFVAFCDLVRNPTAYDKKIVRTKAILAAGTDARSLWSSDCDERDFWISEGSIADSDKNREKVFTAIDKFRGGKEGSWLFQNTEIDVVGQFFYDEDGSGRHFEMLEVKGARALSNSIR
jgi:hypothetical protein